MLKRKVCVITGSRAEYGHLYWLIKAIKDDPDLMLQLFVTGAHLSKYFGHTYKIIEKDGFYIDRKLPILNFGNTRVGISQAIGLGCAKFANAFHDLKPDVVVVCGDRYEILAAVISAHVAAIPVVHLHGGETSQGAIDEAFRHAISKMSYLHFAATEDYRKRVIQLGENPKRVFNFGAPGLDNISKLKLLNRQQLRKELGFGFEGPTVLMTFHPETLSKEAPVKTVRSVLTVLRPFGFKVIITKANADPLGQAINDEIEKFCEKHPENFKCFSNLGQLRYLSCMKHVDLMIGNSSSGIVESSSFGLPAINLGDRQKGRVKARNVIDSGLKVPDIKRAVTKALSKNFKKQLKGVKNPYQRYGGGNISLKIKEKIKMFSFKEGCLKKRFYNV